MKSSQVFEKAAYLVFKRDELFACNALSVVSMKPYDAYWGCLSPELTAFESMFQQEETDEYGGWFGDIYKPENRLARQLALLLMAEMSKELEK